MVEERMTMQVLIVTTRIAVCALTRVPEAVGPPFM